ncbi:MAG: hypothetical protein U1F67_10775 [Rubrivivax sp.]
MTQLGESVTVGMIDDNESPCPFDHTEPEPPAVDNDLIGIGSTLARRMKGGKSTLLYEPMVRKVEEVLDPRHREGHEFKDKARVVKVPIAVRSPKKGQPDTVLHAYPVTCAAHHCIPAQESLKHSKLLAYMVKKGSTEKLKDGKQTIDFSDGRVWADVGYDVNGAENGVYLPGNYAVGGGRGGMRVWEGADDNEDDDDEEPEVDAADMMSDDAIDDGQPKSNMLTGELYDVSSSNRKWRYVRQAMRKAPGQFHDRHEDYSAFVLEVLEKIFANYKKLEEKHIDQQKCKECKKKTDKIAELGLPTPFGLATRLNGVSGKMRGHLSGPQWPPNVYTSKWAKNYLGVLADAAERSPKRRRSR